jgi:hypothetical protein
MPHLSNSLFLILGAVDSEKIGDQKNLLRNWSWTLWQQLKACSHETQILGCTIQSAKRHNLSLSDDTTWRTTKIEALQFLSSGRKFVSRVLQPHCSEKVQEPYPDHPTLTRGSVQTVLDLDFRFLHRFQVENFGSSFELIILFWTFKKVLKSISSRELVNSSV